MTSPAPAEIRYPPLVLLHPSAKSSLFFDRLLPLIGTDRIAIAFDTPGFGDSSAFDEQPSIAEYARSLTLAISNHPDMTSAPQLDLLGRSTGSAIAIEIAVQWPVRVRRVVLSGVPMFSDTFATLYRERASGPRPINEQGSHLAYHWKREVADRGEGISLERGATMFVERMKTGQRYQWGTNAVVEYEIAERIGQVQQSVLILNPNNGLTEFTKQATPLFPNAELMNVPQWNNNAFELHTEQVTELLRSFLE